VAASGVEAISEEQKKQIQEFTGANLGGVFKKKKRGYLQTPAPPEKKHAVGAVAAACRK
jgi:hypothetical protein